MAIAQTFDPLALAPAKVLGPREGLYTAAGDEHVYVKLLSGDTGGQFILAELYVEPGTGPKEHIHAYEDEVFIVLDGEVEIWVDGNTRVLKAGDMAWGPRNVAHTWKAVGTKTAHFYVLATGDNFERFFGKYLPALQAGDMETVERVAKEHGITFVERY